MKHSKNNLKSPLNGVKSHNSEGLATGGSIERQYRITKQMKRKWGFDKTELPPLPKRPRYNDPHKG